MNVEPNRLSISLPSRWDFQLPAKDGVKRRAENVAPDVPTQPSHSSASTMEVMVPGVPSGHLNDSP